MIIFILTLFALLTVSLMILPSGSADFLDEDPDEDGYDGQFSRPGEELFTTAEEYENGTDPLNPDSDNDLMPDGWEVRWDFNPNDPSDADLDSDGDGVSNVDEYFADTNPRDVDLDHDGIPDIWEDIHGLNSSDPNDALEDPDNDGLSNIEEFLNQTLPFNEDTDGDGMWDGWEVMNGLNPRNPNDAAPDYDFGGVSNVGEFFNMTDPWDPTDDFGNIGGGNGGTGIPTGDGVPPDTGRTDNEVTIINVFEPPLGTLKRWQVLDGLGSNYLIYLRDNTTTVLPVSSGDYNFIFYGRINVSLEEGRYFRIPNPAPDSVLLDSYFQAASLTFYKDPADNYYVLAPYDGDPDVVTRYEGILFYTMGTNGNYFTLDIPQVLTTDDIPDGLLPNITVEIRGSVDWFLDNADDPGVRNLEDETNLKLIVTNLTSYFSNFSEGNGDVPDPVGNQDIYQAISINKIGACRHRSFAFFVTANALGIPTRYVANEAHCFVEVYIPEGEYSDSNWHRINLGGTGSADPGEPRPDDPPGTNETVIRLDPIPATLYMGDPFTLTGSITTLNATPLPYHPFIVMSGTVPVGTGSSNATGNITLEFILTDTRLGPNNLSLIAIPHSGYLGNVSENRSFELFTEVFLNPSIPASMTYGRGSTIYVSGYLSSVNGTALASENISMTWDGSEVDYFITTGQGEYNLSYSVSGLETPGQFDLILSFTGHEYYLNSTTAFKVEINVTKVLMNAQVEPSSQDASALVYVTGRITDELGNNVSTRGNLVIILHGMELVNDSLSRYTDAGGKDFNATVRIPFNLGRGNYFLHVAFHPDPSETIPSNTRNLDLYVDKITTYVYLFPGIIEIGELYTINGTLYSGSGIPVAGSIALYWDGDYLTTVNVGKDGDFFYNDITRRSPGPLTIGAYYNGSDMFTPSFSVVNYSVFSYTSLIIVGDPDEGWITRDQNITITGWLIDDNSVNVTNMNIFLYAVDSLGKEHLISEVITDSSGFTLTYYLAPDYLPGPLTLEILFRETGYYRGSSSELSYQVQAYTTIDITQLNTRVQAGTNLTLRGTFYDDMGHMLELPLTITFMDIEYVPILESGNFSWELTIPLTQESGDFDLTVAFEAMNYYESSFNTAVITIYHLTTITVSPYNLTRGDLGTFSGIIRDELGNGIPGLWLDIYLRDTYLGHTTTEEDGTFLEHIPLDDDLDLGPAYVLILFNGTSYFDTSERNYTIDVYASTHIDLIEITFATRDELFLQGHLFDNLGDPLSGQNITIFFSNDKIFLTTNESGFFRHHYVNSTMSLAFYTVIAQFPRHEFYHFSESATTIHVVSYLTITINNNPDPVAGYGYIISGNVTDDRGNPVTVELNATLSSNMGTFWKYPVAMIGQYNTTWTLEPYRIPGFYTLYVNNSNPYPYTHYLASSNSTVVFMMRATYITLKVPDGVRGEMVTITGSLLDVANNSIPSAEVRITFDGLVDFLQTDGDGNFSHTFEIPPNTEPGAHQIVTFYEGNLTLLPITYYETLWVYVPTHLIMNSSRAHWSLIDISGEVKDNLNENVQGYVDLFFDGKSIGTVFAGPTGFRVTYPHAEVGIFEAKAMYQPFTFYLASSSSANYTLFTYYKMSITINSSIYDSIPEEFELEHPVLAGDYFNLTLNITTDLGIKPPNIDLLLIFGGESNKTNLSNSRTRFYVDTELHPLESHVLKIEDIENDTHFELFPNPTDIEINVIHPTKIVVTEDQIDGKLILSGSVRDSHSSGRNVPVGEINVSLEGEYIDVNLNSGAFQYESNVSARWGPENYTFIYPANKYYLGSQRNFTVNIKAFTILTLSVPDSLYFEEKFKGTVKLTYLDGEPISNADIILTFGDNVITASTDKDGRYRFNGIMDSNHSITVTAEFRGDTLFYSSEDSKEISIKDRDGPPIDLSSFFTTRALFLYIIFGTAGFYLWRRKQIKYLMSLVHDSALRLDAGDNPKSVIFIAYNLMCRHLRRFNLIRRNHETVNEFKGTTQKSMRLSDDGIGNLTQMMEYADYSNFDTGEGHKERAVQSLRNVERELAGLGAPRRKR